MIIKTILVPVRGDGHSKPVLDHALALARRFGGHIDVVHSHPRPENILPYGIPVSAAMKETILESAAVNAAEEEGRVRTLFDDYCKQKDLQVVDGPSPDRSGVTISWRERTGIQASVVALYGRLADVIVVPRPDAAGLGARTLESALLETGKLVLIAPPKPAGDLAGGVAIAWNGSAEAAGAVGAAMDLLARAASVTILSAPGAAQDELSAADLVEYLQWHGVVSKITEVEAPHPHDVGDALLAATAASGMDMLLMGGYGQERRRQLVMGGVTRHIIETAEIPVMMLH